MNIIVFGATGTVGAEVVREAILDAGINQITAVVRRPLEIADAKLKIVLHENYLDYSSLTEVFKDSNTSLWCLGISQSQVNEQEYIKITYDYALAAARAMLEANPQM